MTQRGLDHVEHVGPDHDVRYVHGRTPRRPDMCPECFSTDTSLHLVVIDGQTFVGQDMLCNACGEIFT